MDHNAHGPQLPGQFGLESIFGQIILNNFLLGPAQKIIFTLGVEKAEKGMDNPGTSAAKNQCNSNIKLYSDTDRLWETNKQGPMRHNIAILEYV